MLQEVFFFQAEDGIRDLTVTGVQTCALPIWRADRTSTQKKNWPMKRDIVIRTDRGCSRSRPSIAAIMGSAAWRSEERRVGKESRSRWSPDHLKKKKNNFTLIRVVDK